MTAAELLARLNADMALGWTARDIATLRTLLPELLAVVEAAAVETRGTAAEVMAAHDRGVLPLGEALDALDARAAELAGE